MDIPVMRIVVRLPRNIQSHAVDRIYKAWNRVSPAAERPVQLLIGFDPGDTGCRLTVDDIELVSGAFDDVAAYLDGEQIREMLLLPRPAVTASA